MRYQVKLRIIRHEQDNYYGFDGLLPDAAYHRDTFDPFWSPEGIFHDIFEHWFEGVLPRFSGNREFSLYGEMVASAVKCYLYNRVGVDAFKFRNNIRHRTFFEDTESMFYDLYHQEGSDYEPIPLFSTTLPERNNSWDYPVEYVISNYLDELKDKYGYKFMARHRKQIISSYRYGWRLADKLWGQDRGKSYEQLEYWLDTLNNLCKRDVVSLHVADEMAYPLKWLQATVNTEAKEMCRLHWIDDIGNAFPFSAVEDY